MSNFHIIRKNWLIPINCLFHLSFIQIDIKIVGTIVDSGWDDVTNMYGKTTAGNIIIDRAGSCEGHQGASQTQFSFQVFGPRWVRLDIIIPIDIGFGLRNTYKYCWSRCIG